MANTAHGNTAYVFGIDAGYVTILDATVKLETVNIESQPEFEALGKDATGAVASRVIGALAYSFTASGYMVGAGDNIPAGFGVGAMFTIESHQFIVKKVAVNRSNTEFKKIEITGKAYKLVVA